MDPLRNNKVDLSKLTADEQRIFRLYGKLPSRNELLAGRLKDRKYFDSGDYALSKAAGKKPADFNVGSQHPSPEKIPRSHPSRGSVVGSIAGSSGANNGGNIPIGHFSHLADNDDTESTQELTNQDITTEQYNAFKPESGKGNEKD